MADNTEGMESCFEPYLARVWCSYPEGLRLPEVMYSKRLRATDEFSDRSLAAAFHPRPPRLRLNFHVEAASHNGAGQQAYDLTKSVIGRLGAHELTIVSIDTATIADLEVDLNGLAALADDMKQPRAEVIQLFDRNRLPES